MWFGKKAGQSKRATPRTPDRDSSVRRTAQGGRRTLDEEELVRRKLPVDYLAPGIKVVEPDRPWTDIPVLLQEFVITDPSQVEVLRHYCNWVLAEAPKSVMAAIEQRLEALRTGAHNPFAEERALHEELPRARQAYADVLAFVDSVTKTIEEGGIVNLEGARPLVRQCVDSIKANPNALFWLARVKSQDAYTAEHSLRVAIFAIAFGRFMDMTEEDLEIVGLCGLLHDLGKLKIKPDILNKPSRLDPEEMNVMQKHAEFGWRMLQSSPGSVPDIVLDVTRHHHERLNGTGYPDGLKAQQISRFARLIAIVDVYDAITSDRVYRGALSSSEAIRILYEGREEQFDPDMIEAFIRMVGVYPPGSLVELTTGEVAIVRGSHPAHRLKPRVEIVLGPDKTPCEHRLLDLTKSPPDMTGTPYGVRRTLPDNAYGVSLQQEIDRVAAV